MKRTRTYILYNTFFVLLTAFTIHSVSGQEQKSIYDGGSPFSNGFARIERSGHFFYIDTAGQYVFDRILSGNLNNSVMPLANADGSFNSGDTTLLPENNTFVSRKGKLGVLSVGGKWILRPEYDSLDTRSRSEWLVKKDGKMSLFTKAGFLLPFQFACVYNMDGNYLNVMQAGKWGVYSRKEQRVVVPFMYDDVDYCYGCEEKGDYFFAEKDGKWGVVDFKNNVLLPFEYDHTHINMRSDEWVECLSKGGQSLSINLKTKKIDTSVSSYSDTDQTEAMAGGFVRREKNGKWGMLNAEGKLILGYAYDFIRYDADASGIYLASPFVSLNKDDKKGIADTTGKVIVPPIYDEWLSGIADSFFIGEKDNRTVLLNAKGDRVIPGDYDAMGKMYSDYFCDSCAVPLVRIRDQGLSGFYNIRTGILVPPTYSDLYDDISVHAGKHYLVTDLNGKKGLIDPMTGEQVLPPVYGFINSFRLPAGLAIVADSAKSGLYDIERKKWVIPLMDGYMRVSGDSSMLEVTKQDKSGFMDFSGKEICPPDYDLTYRLDRDHLLLVKQDSGRSESGTYSVLDKRAGRITILPYDTVNIAGVNALLIVTDQGKMKLLDAATGEVVQGEYAKDGFPDFVDPFINGLAVIGKNGKQGFMDTSGKIVLALQYDSVSNFYQGISLVMKEEDRWGNPLYGYIDRQGKMLVPIQYSFDRLRDITDYFHGNYLTLLKPGQAHEAWQMGYATRDGDVFIPPLYSGIYFRKDGRFIMVKKEKKYGLLDGKGQVLIRPVFDQVGMDNAGYLEDYSFSFPLLAKKGDVWGYYSPSGKRLPEFVRSMIGFFPSFPSGGFEGL